MSDQQAYPVQGQPSPGTAVVQSQGERPWTHGLFSCFEDCGACFVSSCFPCVAYGQNKSRFAGTSCCLDCCVYLMLGGCCGCLAAGNRSAMRRRYGVAGGGMEDCCVHMWCSPCAMTQEKRELDAVGAPIQ